MKMRTAKRQENRAWWKVLRDIKRRLGSHDWMVRMGAQVEITMLGRL